MASSPPTPPSRSPNDDEWRFNTITLPCEWIEDYHPGGYHPVNLGDEFKNGQYKVIRNLGNGAYSTVWLAQDSLQNIFVALKILVSNASQSSIESEMVHRISRISPIEGRRYIIELLDEFKHEGPNGTHKCLIFEPMGPSVSSMVEELPQFKPRKWGMKIRYPPWMAKSILKQSLQALAFLHQNGISHGDFQPGNILFAIPNINEKPVELLYQKEHGTQPGPVLEKVRRLDDKDDKWAPKYLHVAQSLAAFTPFTDGFKVKLCDLGGAFLFAKPPANIVTPRGLRTPEFILTGAVHKSLDIWSFGCLIFELITGRPLFCVPGSSHEDDGHILSFIAALGPLPNDLFNQWKTSSFYFIPDGELFNCRLGGVAEGEQPLLRQYATMEQLFDQANPEIGEKEAGEIKALILWILQYDPEKRPTAVEILSHPWFH